MNELFYIIKKYLPRVFYPLYIEYSYLKIVNRWCNLNNPKTYTEKMQWGKLNRKDSLLGKLSDKIAVRSWVEERIGSEYLIPIIGHPFCSVDEIDFDELPNKYVIKANHGSGFNYVVNNKDEIDVGIVKKKVALWLKHNYAFYSMELHYKDIMPRLYIEQNIIEEGMSDLPDYKFFCFNGKVF